MPLRTVQRLVTRVLRPRVDLDHARADSPDRIAWAVLMASRHVPGGGPCLPQALATQTLLEREGYSAHLHIGIAKDAEWQFRAHAWVESQGRIVIGGPDTGRDAPLFVLEREIA